MCTVWSCSTYSDKNAVDVNYPIKISVSQRKDFSMIFVGIDISKLTFDVAVLIDGKYVSRQFENKQSGF